MSKLNIKVYKNIMSANEAWAEKSKTLLAEKKVSMWNLIGSPGSGKTAILEKLYGLLVPKMPCAVLEGDVETTNDAERLARVGIPVRQILTHGACHLGAEIIYRALSDLTLDEIACVFVENVGNLVCPAEFDIGERGKIAVLSVTEGEDKPLKYPLLFREAKAAILTKIDLLPHLPVDLACYRANIKAVNSMLPVFEVSALRGEGIGKLAEWFLSEIGKDQ
jgi:hydrogenase nickel incorporation protein HypB